MFLRLFSITSYPLLFKRLRLWAFLKIAFGTTTAHKDSKPSNSLNLRVKRGSWIVLEVRRDEENTFLVILFFFGIITFGGFWPQYELFLSVVVAWGHFGLMETQSEQGNRGFLRAFSFLGYTSVTWSEYISILKKNQPYNTVSDLCIVVGEGGKSIKLVIHKIYTC